VPSPWESPDFLPDTHYARNGDVHIAYQEFGQGEITFVGLPGIVSNLELLWEDPDSRGYLTGLAAFCRCVIFDKRGQGLSDRDTGVPTLDERLGDLTAVLDAVGAERVALGGISEGGTTAAMYAATFPERVSHLVLVGSFARVDVERGDWFMPRWAQSWGTPETLSLPVLAASKRGDTAFLRWLTRFERQSSSPGGLLAAWRWVREVDVRPVLETIQCPTLVLHRKQDVMVAVVHARYLADHIPGAELVELDGMEHGVQWGDYRSILEHVESFLTGRAPAPRPVERVLATVLFTDIVDSTSRASALGDAAWRQLLDRHDRLCQDLVSRFGGRLVKGTGDGLLATFDAPGRCLACASALRGALTQAGIEIRAGAHTGEIERRGEDIGGVGVHIAARVQALAGPGQIVASRTVKDLVTGSGLHFLDGGTHRLKGVPDEWQVFVLSDAAVATSPAG
jgi:class 3 adenylate cyclase